MSIITVSSRIEIASVHINEDGDLVLEVPETLCADLESEVDDVMMSIAEFASNRNLGNDAVQSMQDALYEQYAFHKLLAGLSLKSM